MVVPENDWQLKKKNIKNVFCVHAHEARARLF
jgi:hypothetical protein